MAPVLPVQRAKRKSPALYTRERIPRPFFDAYLQKRNFKGTNVLILVNNCAVFYDLVILGYRIHGTSGAPNHVLTNTSVFKRVYIAARQKGIIMRKKINNVLNIIMESFVGVWIGRAIYVYWDYKTHPGLYAAGSVPWYTSILVYGAVALFILVICFLIKLFIKKGIQTSN